MDAQALVALAASLAENESLTITVTGRKPVAQPTPQPTSPSTPTNLGGNSPFGL